MSYNPTNANGLSNAAGSAPVVQSIESASGNITTQNLVPAGTATANSAVEISLNGASTLGIQVTGTYTGALTVQASMNGTTWVTLGGLPIVNMNTGGYLTTITSALQSIFQADVSGALTARVTGLSAMTGTATVTLKTVNSPAFIGLDTPLPTGANSIGAVTLASTTLTGGQTAHSSASTGSPVRVGGRVVETTAATQDQTLVAGDAANLPISTGNQAIVKPYATSDVDWHYVAATGGIVSTTTAVTIKAASGTAGIRNYITSIDISAIGAGTATELAIRDGAGGSALWRIQIPAAGITNPFTIHFPTPIRGTANTLLEVVTLTSSATPVFFNAHGYTNI